MFAILDYLYFPGAIALLIFLGTAVFRYAADRAQAKEREAYEEEVRKLELQRLLENREERLIMEPYPEDAFWTLIERTTKRAKPGYTFQLGVLRDYLSDFSAEDLIRFDNLYHKLIKENISHDLTAAATIVFKNGDLGMAVLLMNLFMMQGEVFFKNACHNPNIMIGKNIEHIEGRRIEDLVADLYLRKTRKLIPLMPEPETPVEIAGDPWKERDLPSRFSELWQAFA